MFYIKSIILGLDIILIQFFLFFEWKDMVFIFIHLLGLKTYAVLEGRTFVSKLGSSGTTSPSNYGAGRTSNFKKIYRFIKYLFALHLKTYMLASRSWMYQWHPNGVGDLFLGKSDLEVRCLGMRQISWKLLWASLILLDHLTSLMYQHENSFLIILSLPTLFIDFLIMVNLNSLTVRLFGEQKFLKKSKLFVAYLEEQVTHRWNPW